MCSRNSKRSCVAVLDHFSVRALLATNAHISTRSSALASLRSMGCRMHMHVMSTTRAAKSDARAVSDESFRAASPLVRYTYKIAALSVCE